MAYLAHMGTLLEPSNNFGLAPKLMGIKKPVPPEKNPTSSDFPTYKNSRPCHKKSALFRDHGG